MTAYRNDLDALAAREAALAVELEAKRRELDEASRVLGEALAMARLPVLDDIRVAAPCSVPWASMVGDHRSRHCGQCDERVYDLSDLTREEAQALIVAKEGHLCVRYYRRTDGTILLKDCVVGVRRRRGRALVAAGAAALLAVGGGALMLGHRGEAATPSTCDSVNAEAELEAAETEAAREAARARYEAERAEAMARGTVTQGRMEHHLSLTPAEVAEANERLEAERAETEAFIEQARLDTMRALSRREDALDAARAAEQAAAAARKAQAEAERALEAEKQRIETLTGQRGAAHELDAE